MPAIEQVFLNPVSRGGLSLGASLGPELFEAVGQAPENPKDGDGVRFLDPAVIFPVSYVQSVVSAVLDAPTSLFKRQPLFFV